MRYVGIDFGTTNTAMTLFDAGQASPRPQVVTHDGRPTLPSMVYLSHEEAVSRRIPGVFTGYAALEQYQEEEGSGRLLLSPKSLLGSESFEYVQVLATQYTASELAGLVLRDLRAAAEAMMGPVGHRAVVGRPVRFARATVEAEDRQAEDRLREAFAQAGFTDVTFVYEPIAAAHARELEGAAGKVLLVADLGGGTSDFSVMRLGETPAASKLLAVGGVGVAGDKFDSRIVEVEVAPRLGRGGDYIGLGGKLHEIPDWLYVKLSDWRELSLMKSGRPFEVLREVARTAEDKEALEAFLDLVVHNDGVLLYQQVARVKAALSAQLSSAFAVELGSLAFESVLTREDFEFLIEGYIGEIQDALLDTLTRSALAAGDVDYVLLTGGTSFVPRVREMLSGELPVAEFLDGHEFTSVATGLCRIAQQRGIGTIV